MNWYNLIIPALGAVVGFLVTWGGMRVVVTLLKEEITHLRAATDEARIVVARLETRLTFFERDLDRVRAELLELRAA